MPTITNEPVPGAAAQGANASASNAGQPTRRTDAAGVEIQVVVHASRSSAAAKGVSKPLPAVHEETRTVIVFPQGAVVRLTAAVTIGELVVLTNQRSGADVLCRVASVKAQPGIQNYVDLEFTQRAPGFWGDSFSAAPPVAGLAGGLTPTPAPMASTVASPVSARPAAASSQPAVITSAVPSVVPSAPPAVVTQQPAAPPRMTTEPTFSQPMPVPAAAQEHEVPAWANTSPGSGPSNAPSSMPSARPEEAEETQAWAQRIEPKMQDESSSGPKKTWLIGVAAVVLLGLAGGGYMLSRGHASQSAPQAAAASQTIPQQQQTQAVAPAPFAPQVDVSVVSAAQPVVSAGPSIQPAVISSDSGVNKPAGQPIAPAAKQIPPQKGVVTGKLSVPMPRTTIASSAEPPPLLPAGASASALGNGLLVSNESVNGPSMPAAANAPPAGGGHFEEPRLVSSTPPAYPAAARTQHIQGDVLVDVLVDGTGHVSVAKVISGNGLLQQAALNAARSWVYQPARLDGEPRATHMQVKITFRLP